MLLGSLDTLHRQDRPDRGGRLTLDRLVGGTPGTHEPAPEDKARYEAQFEVVDAYYGSWIEVAAALVRDPDDPEHDRIEVACAPGVRLDQKAEELLFRTCALYHRVDLTFGPGRDRALSMQMVFNVVAGLFKDLDRTAARSTSPDAVIDCREIAYLEKAYRQAEEYFSRAAQRRAQIRYLGGMVAGFAIVAAVGFLLSIGFERLPGLRGESTTFLACLVAGAGGALLSVLFAMTSGGLRLHTLFAGPESGRGALFAAGALRPLVGALSGVVVYVFLSSGLLPLKVPDGGAETNFFIALGIVAGFSERWARGVLAGTEHRMGVGKDPELPPAAVSP